MKKWLPSGKSVAVWFGAFALVAWTLPQSTTSIPIQWNGLHTQQAPTGAVPAVAQLEPLPTQSNPPQGSLNSTTPSVGSGGSNPHAQPKVQPQPQPRPDPPAQVQPPTLPTQQPFSPYVPWPTAKLRIRVIDGRTEQPLAGAEVVVIETEERLTTDKDGYTPWTDAPIIRNPRYRPMVAELHGQLGVIVYKNGYRDSIHLGIRMHDGMEAESTVWMYRLGPGDTRIEPVLYQVPYHHIWLVELADKFRSKTQPGEGPERP